MAHSGINHLRLAGRWAVTQTVIRSAKKGSTFYYLARNAELGLPRVVAFLWRNDPRINRRTATGFDHRFCVSRDVPVSGPFPDVPSHVMQPITVRREGADR